MMKKSFFVSIIILMFISLIGIISVQYFWISNNISMHENHFSSSVKTALLKISEDIKEQEFTNFYLKITSASKEHRTIKDVDVRKFIFEKVDTLKNERFVYSQSIIESHQKVMSDIFFTDSIDYTEIFSNELITIKINPDLTENKSILKIDDPTEYDESYSRFGKIEKAEKVYIEQQFDAISKKQPIYKRINTGELRNRLLFEFENRGITADFNFAVYANNLETSIKTEDFKNHYQNYIVPIFADSKGNSVFDLRISFPKKSSFILASITRMLLFSILFIAIIIIIFIASIKQLVKQKKISEIKTDFINNMTHEFKTPIATINLALDAIKNPKVIGDEKTVTRYVNMIQSENKRMNAQVENVLQISKLEKDQLNITKEIISVHSIVKESIEHIKLIVSNRGGLIKKDFQAKENQIYGNKFHIKNVIINILDNAIKYSDDLPNIYIETLNYPKYIIIKISDKGIGMTSTTLKSIFQTFYREEKGNIHNVKGHGLGLSYAKKIIEKHDGFIFAESDKGKGSTFTIKLPLKN